MFFSYFNKTWLKKYPFELFSYDEKKKLGTINIAIEEETFLSNNCCESLNVLIKSLIQYNADVSGETFLRIIKQLLIHLDV